MTYEQAIAFASRGQRILWVVGKTYRQRELDFNALADVASECGLAFKLNRARSEISFENGGFIKLYTNDLINHGTHRGIEWHWTNEHRDDRVSPYVRAVQ